MTSKVMKTSEFMLSIMLKTITAHKCCQTLIDDAVKLMQHDNNDRKSKHDCFKKLRILNI